MADESGVCKESGKEIEEEEIEEEEKIVEGISLAGFAEEYKDLFTGGKVWDPTSPSFIELVAKIAKELPFPFPLITGSSRNGTI